MTTQTELRNEVSYEMIQRVAAALAPSGRWGGLAGWRAQYTDDAMHALGYVLADLMFSADIHEWETNGAHFSPQWWLGNRGPADKLDKATVITIPGCEPRIYGHDYQGPREHYGGAVDREMLGDWARLTHAAIVAPDIAGHCGQCNGPIWYDEASERGECVHCGVPVKTCESDCFELGGDVCFHHGSPTLPVALVEAHGGDWDAAALSLVGDDHTRAVFRAASSPGGIWNFPNGNLLGGD